MRPRLSQTSGVALGLFLITLTIYWFSAVLLGRRASPDTAYFNYLADAFLHGRLFLNTPPSTSDLTLAGGRWYVPFPPLSALLLLPWAALSGGAGVNTVLFGAIVGAVNVALVFLLLQSLAKRSWTPLSLGDNLWLTVLFGFGSVHWYMATLGSVWFVSQLCTATFMLLAIWLCITNGSPLLAGGALALALLARPPVLLCYPCLFAIAVQRWRDESLPVAPARVASWVLRSAIPLGISVAALLVYNYVRFGSAFDFGYLRQNVATELIDDLRTYGQFNLHYAPKNLWVMWLAGPQWDATSRLWLPDRQGMSLLLTTPALVALLRLRSRMPVVIGAGLAVALLLIPLITYYNTGWWQFGYRFSLDFMPPLMILFAFAARQRVGWVLRILILLGVLVNLWGVWWFLNPRFFF